MNSPVFLALALPSSRSEVLPIKPDQVPEPSAVLLLIPSKCANIVQKPIYFCSILIKNLIIHSARIPIDQYTSEVENNSFNYWFHFFIMSFLNTLLQNQK